MEMLIGAVLFGLSLIYLMTHYKALSGLTNLLTEEAIKDNSAIQQYNSNALDQVNHAEIYAAIMGYREYPIMVDDNLIPVNGDEYELYFSYIKNGLYKKQYQYDANRNIEMIVYSFMGK